MSSSDRRFYEAGPARSAGAARPRRARAALLAVVVLAVHLALLTAPLDTLREPGAQAVGHPFAVRAIAPKPAAAPVAAPAVAPAPPPPTPKRPRPPAPLPAVQPDAPPKPAPPAAASEPPPPPLAQAPQPEAVPPVPAAPEVGAPQPQQQASPPPGMPYPNAVTPDASHIYALPAPARMYYELSATFKGVPVSGKAELHWKHNGSRYEAVLVAGNFLETRTQRSSGTITPEGLTPERFSESGRRGETATHFVREKDQPGRIVFSNNRPEADLLAGAQDRLSVVIQLSAIIGGEPQKYPPGTAIALPTASTRDADTWVFTVEGEEELQLPGGTVRGLKLQRVPRKEFDVKVELWLAPGMDYAPVRLRLTNPNGDAVDQRWSSTDKG